MRTIIAENVKGTVKWFNVRNRYGFIGRDDNGDDIFIHSSAIAKPNRLHWRRSLDVGESVLFNIVDGRKGLEAVNLTAADGGVVQGSTHARLRRSFSRHSHSGGEGEAAEPKAAGGRQRPKAFTVGAGGDVHDDIGGGDLEDMPSKIRGGGRRRGGRRRDSHRQIQDDNEQNNNDHSAQGAGGDGRDDDVPAKVRGAWRRVGGRRRGSQVQERNNNDQEKTDSFEQEHEHADASGPPHSLPPKNKKKPRKFPAKKVPKEQTETETDEGTDPVGKDEKRPSKSGPQKKHRTRKTTDKAEDGEQSKTVEEQSGEERKMDRELEEATKSIAQL